MRSFSTPMPRLRDAMTSRSILAGALVSAVLLLAAGAGAADDFSSGAAGWESLLGDRPAAQLGGRWIVVLAKPSLATKVAAAGGTATEAQERGWTAAARSAQDDVLARLAFHGVQSSPSRPTIGCSTVSRPHSMRVPWRSSPGTLT